MIQHKLRQTALPTKPFLLTLAETLAAWWIKDDKALKELKKLANIFNLILIGLVALGFIIH